MDWDSLESEPAGSDGGQADGGSDAASETGCSDGTREGIAGFARIAACAGAWSTPGVVDALPPGCDRQAGDDGALASGEGCNVSDLCATGWHVCRDQGDVHDHEGSAACEELASADQALFLTRQRGDHNTLMCAETGAESADNAFGCGSLGAAMTGCGPLDRRLALPSSCPELWFDCGANDTLEGENVVRLVGSGDSGVLCCAD